jgi:cytochrome c oxidase assembly factor CtaG
MSKAVSKVSTKFMQEFSSLFTQNKGYVELFVVTLLLLQYMPEKIFFVNTIDSEVSKVRTMVNQVVTPILQHPLTVMILFVLAVYSYYVKRDMNFFFILLITFIARKQ